MWEAGGDSGPGEGQPRLAPPGLEGSPRADPAAATRGPAPASSLPPTLFPLSPSLRRVSAGGFRRKGYIPAERGGGGRGAYHGRAARTTRPVSETERGACLPPRRGPPPGRPLYTPLTAHARRRGRRALWPGTYLADTRRKSGRRGARTTPGSGCTRAAERCSDRRPTVRCGRPRGGSSSRLALQITTPAGTARQQVTERLVRLVSARYVPGPLRWRWPRPPTASPRAAQRRPSRSTTCWAGRRMWLRSVRSWASTEALSRAPPRPSAAPGTDLAPTSQA